MSRYVVSYMVKNQGYRATLHVEHCPMLERARKDVSPSTRPDPRRRIRNVTVMSEEAYGALEPERPPRDHACVGQPAPEPKAPPAWRLGI